MWHIHPPRRRRAHFKCILCDRLISANKECFIRYKITFGHSCHSIVAVENGCQFKRKKEIMSQQVQEDIPYFEKQYFTTLSGCLQTQMSPALKQWFFGWLSSTKPFKITPILPKYSYYVHHITCFTSNQPRSLTSALHQQ